MRDEVSKEQQNGSTIKIVDSAVVREADKFAQELRKRTDNNKIRPLKQLAKFGNFSHLRYILPITQYSSEFIRKLARNTACRIILRELRKSTENEGFPEAEKKKYVDLLISLDSKYKYLNDFDLRDQKIQAVLYDILAQENKEFTAKRLGEILIESDNYIRATAVKIIAEILNNTQTNLLIKLLRDPDARVRANVIEALESIGNPNVVGILLRYKMDKDERVRANTLKALWNLGHRDIESALSEMLFDENTAMRVSGIWVIGEIGHNQPSLKNLLRSLEFDEDPAIKLKTNQARRKISLREREIRILIVDNDKPFLRNFFLQLAGDGFHIHAAFDGNSGLKSSVTHKPEIILISDNLADIEICDLTKKIRENQLTCNIPVIAIIDSRIEGMADRLRDAGINGHLIKPFEYEEFIEVIRSVVKI